MTFIHGIQMHRCRPIFRWGRIRKISCSLFNYPTPDDYEGGHFQWIESAKVFDRIKKRSGDIRLDELIHTAPMSGRELGS